MIDQKMVAILDNPKQTTQADLDAMLLYLQSAEGQALSFAEIKRCLVFLRGKLENTEENNIALSSLYMKASTKSVAPRAVIAEAEKTPETRKAFVEEIRKTQPKKVKDAKTKLRFFLFQSRKALKKPDRETLDDLLFYKLAYGLDYISYFGYGYPGKSVEDRNEYILEKERWIYGRYCNGFIESEVLSDKYKTYQKLKEFFQRDMIRVRGFSDYDAFRSFVNAHPKYIRKISNFGGGFGVKVVNLEKPFLRGVKTAFVFGYYMLYIFFIQRFLSFALRVLTGHRMNRATLVMEELIKQGEEVAKFNASSVNTVRAVAFKTKTQGSHLAFACLRVGRAGSVVDNAHSGGIFIDIDPETGVLCSDAMDDYAAVFPTHPDTGVQFKGAQLPDWEGLKRTVVAMTDKMEFMQYLGWDLAYSDKGWVLVEGNSLAGMDIHQEVAGHGLRKLYYGKQADMKTVYAKPDPSLFLVP